MSMTYSVGPSSSVRLGSVMVRPIFRYSVSVRFGDNFALKPNRTFIEFRLFYSKKWMIDCLQHYQIKCF